MIHTVRFVTVTRGGSFIGHGELSMSGVTPTGAADPETVAASWVHTAEAIRAHMADRGNLGPNDRVVVFDVRETA